MGNMGQTWQFGRDEKGEDVHADGKADILPRMAAASEAADEAGASVLEVDRAYREADGESRYRLSLGSFHCYGLSSLSCAEFPLL